MKLRVLLFAGLAERAGAREWRVDRGGAATIGAFVAALRARHDFLVRVPFLVARNHAIARDDEPLADGDEIALLPPVSGG